MRSSVPTSGRGRGTSAGASTSSAQKPLVVRQTRASAARAAASREQRYTPHIVQEREPWQTDALSGLEMSERLGRTRGVDQDVDNLTMENYVVSSVPARSIGARNAGGQPQQPQQQQRLSGGAAGSSRPAVKRSVPSSSPFSSGGVLTRRSDRPTAVVRSLQTNPNTTSTAKGRAIQQDLDDLADDYFGDAYSQPPVTGGGTFPARSRQVGYGASENGARASQPVTAPEEEKDDDDEEDDNVRSVATDRRIPQSWRRGPTDAEGRLFDSSDQNLLCMDVLLSSTTTTSSSAASGRHSRGGPNVAVVGSADHGLRVFDLDSCKERKNLYTKTCGHTEWVTACRFLPDGRVLSGGMDSKLCLWDSVLRGGPARCQDLLAHTGSISQVEVDRACGTAISASYDRTLRIWSLGGAGIGRDMGCLAGHKGPVTQFHWSDSTVLSGDRQGTAKIWDVSTATCLLTCGTKRGQIGALGNFDVGGGQSTLSLLGDQGGVLTVLDARQGKKPVHQAEVHPGGVLSGIQTTAKYIVTCGADKRICVLDPRANFSVVHEWTDHTDFIYSLKTFGSLVLSGAGNGWLLVHDSLTGECLYGLGASTAAVREMCPTDRYLVAAGDDGKAIVYDFA